AVGWELKNAAGQTVANGTTTPFGPDPASGEQVSIIDFTSFSTKGKGYTLKVRSEEHTSELQSLTNLVCRLLLEKKKHKPPPRPATSTAMVSRTWPSSNGNPKTCVSCAERGEAPSLVRYDSPCRR